MLECWWRKGISWRVCFIESKCSSLQITREFNLNPPVWTLHISICFDAPGSPLPSAVGTVSETWSLATVPWCCWDRRVGPKKLVFIVILLDINRPCTMTYDLPTYGLEHHPGGTDMPMFVLKSFQEPDLNDIKKQEVGFQTSLTGRRVELSKSCRKVDGMFESRFKVKFCLHFPKDSKSIHKHLL